MKTLYVLRHAKSSWDNDSLSDFDRPLNERGLANAPKMAALLHKNYSRPDALLHSPALRTSQTAAAHIAEFVFSSGEVYRDPRIYEAPGSRLVQVLSELPDAVNSALLIGHNPGLSHLILYFTGESVDMPTSGMTVIELEAVSWRALVAGIGTIRGYHFPKKDFNP